jgi:hypothetical protein
LRGRKFVCRGPNAIALSSTFRRPLFELTGSAFHRTTEDVWRQAA